MTNHLESKRIYTLPDEIAKYVPAVANLRTVFKTELVRVGTKQYTYLTGVTSDTRFFRLIIDFIGSPHGVCLYAHEFKPTLAFGREARLDSGLEARLGDELFGSPQRVVQGFRNIMKAG